MYFTKAQMRALWFIIGIFACSVVFQYIRFYFFNNQEYDFRKFDQFFKNKSDSLLAIQLNYTSMMSRDNSASPSSPVIIYQKFPVNINLASVEELQNLPRIGPAMATRIVLHRQKNGPFQTKSDLMNVRGIGKKTFEKLKNLITLK
jgi:comEA protein